MTGLGGKIAGYDIRQDQETVEIVISRGPMFVYSEIVDRRYSFSELQRLLFDDTIFCTYTYADGEVKHLLSGGFRARIFLSTDMILYIEGSSGAGYFTNTGN